MTGSAVAPKSFSTTTICPNRVKTTHKWLNLCKFSTL